MDVIGAAVRVGARPLAGVREEIDPAFVERPLQHRRVLGAERRQRREDMLLRLLRRVRQIDRADERRVQVVIVQLVEAHHPLAQLQVAMERRQRAVDAVDEPRIHRRRDVRAVEHHLQRRRILSRLREEQHLLDIAVHRRPERAAEASERLEKRGHHLLAIGPVRQASQYAERRGVEFRGLAVAEGDARVGEIGVRQDVVDVGRRAGERTRGGQDALLGVAQRMRRTPRDVLDVEAMDLQPRLGGDEFFQRRFRNLQDLRLDVRRFGGERRAQLHHLFTHALRTRFTRVLIGEQADVDKRARQFLVDRIERVERLGKSRRRRRQLALEGADLRELLLDAFLRRSPGVGGRVDLGEVPLVAIRNLRAIAFLRNRRKCEGCGGGGGPEQPEAKVFHSNHCRGQRDLLGERDHRIDSGGAARGQRACRHRHQGEHRGGSRQGERVGGGDLEELALQAAAQRDRADRAKRESRGD